MTTETKPKAKTKTKPKSKEKNGDDPQEKTIWKTLSRIDCSSFTEKKNGLTYLSWSWAWHQVKEKYPNATFHKHKNELGYPCFYDCNGNAFVRVTVKIENEEVTEDLPVLGFKNQGEKNPDAFKVNKSIQRCLVKCLAYMGLGVHIYMGEDYPLTDREELMLIVDAHLTFCSDENWESTVFKHFGVDAWDALSLEDLEVVVKRIKKKESK